MSINKAVRFIISFFFILSLTFGVRAQGKKLKYQKTSAPATLNDSIAYAMGYNLGSQFHRYGIDLNSEAIAKGMQAGISGKKVAFDQEEKTRLAGLLQAQLREKIRAQTAAQTAPPSVPKKEGNVGVHKEAPEIALPNPEGDTLRLSDFRGKYVLVDFWASWCRPCRIENPRVVALYEKYQDQNFEILGVSLDRNKSSWLAAIEKDGLTWKHVSDLKFWQSAAAQTYGVKFIPYTVLVDPDGHIEAINLRGKQLEKRLERIFGDS